MGRNVGSEPQLAFHLGSAGAEPRLPHPERHPFGRRRMRRAKVEAIVGGGGAHPGTFYGQIEARDPSDAGVFGDGKISQESIDAIGKMGERFLVELVWRHCNELMATSVVDKSGHDMLAWKGARE